MFSLRDWMTICSGNSSELRNCTYAAMIAFCSSSDLSAKLMLATMSTARSVPSFMITTSSLISLMSKYRWVAGPGFGPESFLDCISGILVFGVVDASRVHHERKLGELGSRERLLPDARHGRGRGRFPDDVHQFTVRVFLVPHAQSRTAERLDEVQAEEMERLAIDAKKSEDAADDERQDADEQEQSEIRQLILDEHHEYRDEQDQELPDRQRSDDLVLHFNELGNDVPHKPIIA